MEKNQKEKIDKILLYGIHDHCSGTNQIEVLIKYIREDMSEKVLTDEKLEEYLKMILKARLKSKQNFYAQQTYLSVIC